MITKTVEVTHLIEVEVDETKLNDEFMQAFTEVFYDFDTIEDHIKHLAQLKARGFIEFSDTFVEGYGQLSELGISLTELDQFEDIVDG